MAISGNLRTMPLAELFQWASSSRKTGVLEIREGRSKIQFLFEDGQIGGCATNDPPSLLGQFLLSRGRLDERTLQQSLDEQERSGGNLGLILVERGVLTREELDRYIKAKAEETIFKLFEWPNASFEFDPTLRPMTSMVRLSMQVEDIMLRGAQRMDELERMRGVFHHPGIVLCRTEHVLHPETASSAMAQRLYELIDGKRTFAEILLLSRASEYLATKFLFELYRRGVIAIKDIHNVAPEPGSPEAACELAERLCGRGELEAAMDILHASLKDNPRHEAAVQALTKLEATYIDRAYQSELAPSRVPAPIPARRDARDAQPLTANELFVLDLVSEGAWDVRSLTRISPLYEIDLIRSLRGLLNKGYIDLREGQETRDQNAAAREVFEELSAEIEESLGVMNDVAPGDNPGQR